MQDHNDEDTEEVPSPDRKNIVEHLIRLSGKLHALSDLVKNNHEASQRQITEVENKFNDLLDHLTGGKDPSKGMIVRLDRVEQRAAVNVKLIWTIIGAAIVGLISWLGKWTSKLP